MLGSNQQTYGYDPVALPLSYSALFTCQYCPMPLGLVHLHSRADNRGRTDDPPLTRRMLYQLSYAGVYVFEYFAAGDL